MIKIWEPKYSTNQCLIDTKKVTEGRNLIQFTKAEHLKGKIYECYSSDIRQAQIVSNGKISCYAVPMEKLKLVSDVVEKPRVVVYNNNVNNTLKEGLDMAIPVVAQKTYDKVKKTIEAKLSTIKTKPYSIQFQWNDGRDMFIYSADGREWSLYENADLVVGDTTFDYVCKIVTNMVLQYNMRNKK